MRYQAVWSGYVDYGFCVFYVNDYVHERHSLILSHSTMAMVSVIQVNTVFDWQSTIEAFGAYISVIKWLNEH